MTSDLMSNNKIRRCLQNVIDNLVDSQQRFQRISEYLHDEAIKTYFLAESLKRDEFRTEIESMLQTKPYHDIKGDGTVLGTLYRAWGELKSHFGGGDFALLDTAEHGENAAERAYKRTLEKKLPLLVHQLLLTQLVHIQKSHNYIRAERDNRT
jgi:uncharacterized protein (TIGR02284 family)